MAMSMAWKNCVSSCLSDLWFWSGESLADVLLQPCIMTSLLSPYFDGRYPISRCCSGSHATVGPFPCFYWLQSRLLCWGPCPAPLPLLACTSAVADLGFTRYAAKLLAIKCLSPDLQNTAFHHFVICFAFPPVGALWLGRSGWHLLTPLSSTMTWHCDNLPSGSWMWLRLPIVLTCTSIQLA